MGAKNGNGHGGRYTAEQMVRAIKDAGGFVTRAAGELGCSPRTIYNYAKRFVTVQQAIDDAREERIDWVEDKLFDQMERGNVTAMIFYLKCQAKSRGYIEKQQIEHMGIDKVTIEVVYDEGIEGQGAPTEAAPQAA